MSTYIGTASNSRQTEVTGSDIFVGWLTLLIRHTLPTLTICEGRLSPNGSGEGQAR